jgi:hypothetical protein
MFKPRKEQRRIIGQCNTADFRELARHAHLMSIGQDPGDADLSKTQKTAFMVLRHLFSCGVTFEVALRLREVLVWKLSDGTAFEYKLLHPGDTITLGILENMQPKKVPVQ